MEERTLAFEGFTYHCRIAHQDRPGTEPLVLLGGSSQNRYAWVRHEKWLAEHCTTVTVDLPGYGTADFLPVDHGIDFLAANVRHMLGELDMPKVNLVGSCFGGAIALRFAQQSPNMWPARAGRDDAGHPDRLHRRGSSLDPDAGAWGPGRNRR
ncbi:alpha/beta fold hydrolase [Streptomyces sp. M10(2022)]